MRIRSIALAAVGVAVVGVACGDSRSSSSPQPTPSPLRADLTGAVGVGILREQVPSSQPSAPSVGELAAYAVDGTVQPVFDRPHEAHHLTELPNYIIVNGSFPDAFVDTNGVSRTCRLVAVPKDANGGPVECLSTEEVGAYGIPALPEGNKSGMDVRGATLFFVTSRTTYGTSELRRWNEGSDTTDPLITLVSPVDGNNDLKQPFAIDGATNICVSTYRKLYCGDPDLSSYAVMDVMNQDVPPDTFRLGGLVLTTYSVVRLSDLQISPRTGFVLPSTADRTLLLTSGGAVGISRVDELVQIAANGNSTTLDASTTYARLVGSGDRGYIYSDAGLFDVDLHAGIVGTSDLLGMVQMLDVTDLTYTNDPNTLRLDGTGSGGGPVAVFVNTSNGDVEQVAQPLPGFGAVIPIQ
jgi:hypothetical protein